MARKNWCRGAVIELDAGIEKMLEELLLEGDLLEVSLDEVQLIWRILQSTAERRKREYPELDQLEAELVAVREERRKEKMRRRKEEVEGKKVAKRSKAGAEKKKKEDDGGEEEDCSAKNPGCRKPTGKQVHWVQCDGCQQWFHLYCIGMKPQQITEDEDFLCKPCQEHFSKGRKRPLDSVEPAKVEEGPGGESQSKVDKK